jgi:hypothetical protein
MVQLMVTFSVGLGGVLTATQSAHDGVTDRADIRPRVLCSSAPWFTS